MATHRVTSNARAQEGPVGEGRPTWVRRWLLPIWIAYSALWLAWFVTTVTVFGGFSSPGQAVSLVLSGIAGVLGLVSGWQVRREDRSSQ